MGKDFVKAVASMMVFIVLAAALFTVLFTVVVIMAFLYRTMAVSRRVCDSRRVGMTMVMARSANSTARR